jgi:hypothetical protein
METIQRLELSRLPFVFYLDADHAQGRLLYHRYDGHYGLHHPRVLAAGGWCAYRRCAGRSPVAVAHATHPASERNRTQEASEPSPMPMSRPY